MSFQIEKLTFCYDETPVLTELSVELPAGEVIVLLGRSGSGKTTLLNLLGTLIEDRLSPGAIKFIQGESELDYANLNGSRRQELRRDVFGFVLQSCYLLPYLTCRENLAIPFELRGTPAAQSTQAIQDIVEASKDHSLEAALDRRPNGVSQGQRQRFAVLRAMAQNPQVIFADEPTSNLDPQSTEKMTELLTAWQAGSTPESPRTLIMVCHSLTTARSIGQRFVLLGGGQVQAVFRREEWDAQSQLLTEHLGSADADLPINPGEPIQLAAAEARTKPQRPGLRFFNRLAFRDLLDARRIWSGLTVLATVVLVTGLAVLASAWPTLAEQRRQQVMASRPNANLMFVSPPYGQLGARISDETRQSFAEKLQAKLGEQLLGIYPTRDVNVALANDRGLFNSLDPPRGRTVRGPDDPQLRGIRWLAGDTLPEAGGAAIVICPRLLEQLHLPAGVLPTARAVHDGWGEPFQVVGLAAENFPQGVSYYLAESEFNLREQARLKRQQRLDAIDTTRLPEEWQKLALSKLTFNAIRDWAILPPQRVELSVVRDGSGFKLRAKKEGLAYWEWQEFLRELQTQAGEKMPGLDISNVPDLKPAPPEWTGITVYIRDLPAQKDVIQICKELDLGVNETVSTQLGAYREATDEARTMLSYIVAFVLLVVGLNVAVIQLLRLSEKRNENALLRAVGMSRPQLIALYVWQSLGVALLGIVLGLVCSLLLLWLFCSQAERLALWQSDLAIRIGYTSLGLGGLLMGTAALAAWLVGRPSPAKDLTGG